METDSGEWTDRSFAEVQAEDPEGFARFAERRPDLCLSRRRVLRPAGRASGGRVPRHQARRGPRAGGVPRRGDPHRALPAHQRPAAPSATACPTPPIVPLDPRGSRRIHRGETRSEHSRAACELTPAGELSLLRAQAAELLARRVRAAPHLRDLHAPLPHLAHRQLPLDARVVEQAAACRAPSAPRRRGRSGGRRAGASASRAWSTGWRCTSPGTPPLRRSATRPRSAGRAPGRSSRRAASPRSAGRCRPSPSP